MTPHASVLQPGGDQFVQNERRRSQRIPLSVPLIVSDPRPRGFSECCETVQANGHGCQLRSSRPLETGLQVRLDAIYTSRVTRATVIHSEPVGREQGALAWNCGLALDTPGNFWSIPSPPCDWSNANGSGSKKDAAAPVSAPSPQRWMPVRESLPGGLDRSSQDQQAASVIDARIADFEARVERAAAEFETGALARLRQSFGETIKQVQERLKHYAEACGNSRLVELEAELEHRLEPFLNRSQAGIHDLERLLETLRQEQGEDRLRGQLAEETHRFHALIHDAVVEASGQVKGRIDTMIETACEPLERRLRDAQAHLEMLVLRKTDEMSRRCEANLQRLHALQEETDRSFRAQLAAQQAEAFDLFQRQAKEAMLQAIARMHTTLNNALESTARSLQDQPSASPAQSPGQDGAGNRQTTGM